MLIINQSKDTIYNMDKIISIECTENGVVMQGDKAESSITLGTYESESRAKEVLQDIMFAYGKNQYEFCSNSKEWCAVRDIYIMPDK